METAVTSNLDGNGGEIQCDSSVFARGLVEMPSATLRRVEDEGRRYLDQGHLAEAADLLREVVDRRIALFPRRAYFDSCKQCGALEAYIESKD